MNGSIFQNFPKCELKKSFEKFGNLFNIWREMGPICILNGSLFLEKLVFVCVCCQIPLRHIPTKTKLECPLGLQISFELIEETYIWSQCCFSPQIPLNLLNPPLFRVRDVDQYSGQVWKKKKVSLSQNGLSLSERESVVINEDVTFARWPPWDFCMA